MVAPGSDKPVTAMYSKMKRTDGRRVVVFRKRQEVIAIGLEGLQGKKSSEIEEEKQDDSRTAMTARIANFPICIPPAGRTAGISCAMARVSWGLPSRLSTSIGASGERNVWLTRNPEPREHEKNRPAESRKGRLLQRAGVEIPIHIDAAERPFNGVDPAVLIAIQLLKMVVGQIECLRTRHAGRRG